MRSLTNKQQGFTLVELMVGLFLGIAIAGIAITYMVSSSASFSINSNESLIQENARFALSILNTSLKRAKADSAQKLRSTEIPSLFLQEKCQNAAGNASRCTSQGSGSNNSDQVAIAYHLSQGTTCSGRDISTFFDPDTTDQIVEIFSIASDTNQINNLYCQSAVLTYAGNFVTHGARVPLVSGIDMMKFLFSVDTDQNFIGDQYMNIDQVINGNWTNNIRSIKVGLVISSGFASDTDANTEAAHDRTYSLFGVSSNTINDGRLRQIFSNSIHLPNALER
jgi:type II secretory pathway pseudopilin PulG